MRDSSSTVLRAFIPVLWLLMTSEPDRVETFFIRETDGEFQKMPGDSIQFSCTVSGRDFDAFTNIIQWKKSQDYDTTATFVISQHSQLLENTDFHKTSRFSVTGEKIPAIQEYSQHSEDAKNDHDSDSNDMANYEYPYGGDYGGQQEPESDFMVILTIYTLQPEDSGLYWCDIQGGGSISHKLEILESVEEVRVRGLTDAYSESKNEREEDYQIYYSNKDGWLECLSIGGYPDPVLNVFAVTRRDTRDDISHFMYMEKNITLVGPTPGLQRYKTYIRKYTNILNLDPMYDKGSITCEGVVDKRVAPRSHPMEIIVKSPPILVREECPTIVGAEIGDLNAEILCRFKCNPYATTVEWVANTTTLNAFSDDAALYKTNFMGVGIHEYELSFVIKNVTAESFQYYELTITNPLGTFNTAILLKEGYNSSDMTRPSLSAILLSVLVTVVLKADRCLFLASS